MFLLKNHVENAVEIIFPDPFLENQNSAYLWIISLTFSGADAERICELSNFKCEKMSAMVGRHGWPTEKNFDFR